MSHFAPVAVPVWHPQLGTVDLERRIGAWVDSPPMRSLVDMSGWSWPGDVELRRRVAALVRLSDGWDFRRNRERTSLEDGAVRVDDNWLDPEPVAQAARALGLVDSAPPGAAHVDHLLVLSGAASACVNRTQLAHSLLDRGLTAGGVWILTGRRPLDVGERATAAGAGLDGPDDEGDLVVAATRQVFDLGGPQATDRRSGGGDTPAEIRRSEEVRWAWPGIQILVVPSSAPRERRVNTADQLRRWARLASVGPTDRVLLVTTQIYVPFQQIEAIRTLGMEHGCAVSAVGVDARSARIPLRAFGPASYLQEVRSTLQAAQRLLEAIRLT